MRKSSKLRALASWYREFAERTDNPMIWEARLRTADELEREADRVDGRGGHIRPRHEEASPAD